MWDRQKHEHILLGPQSVRRMSANRERSDYIEHLRAESTMAIVYKLERIDVRF